MSQHTSSPPVATASKARTTKWFLAILFLALAARVASFSGYFGSDDGGYAVLAHHLATSSLEFPYPDVPVFSLRIGLYAPAALLFSLFGPSEWTLLAYPFLCSILTVVLAFVAGRWLIGDRAALLAAGLAALLPFDARAASTFMPDGPAALWAAVGVLLCRAGAIARGTRRQATFGAMAGGCFVLAWITKESIVYLAPFVIAYLGWFAFKYRRPAALVGCSLACLAGLGLEALSYQAATGSLVYRFETIDNSYEDSGEVWRSAGEWGRLFIDGSESTTAGTYWKALAKRVVAEGPSQLLLDPFFALVPLVALLAALYAAFQGLRRLRFLSFWFLSVAFMFNFFTGTFEGYRPLPLADRFVYLEFFPAILLCAAFLDHLLPDSWHPKAIDRERAFWGVLLAALVLLLSAAGIGRNFLNGPGTTLERSVASVVSPNDRLYTDHRTVSVLEFYWGFPEKHSALSFTEMESRGVQEGDYLLVNEERLSFLEALYGYQRPEALLAVTSTASRIRPGLLRASEDYRPAGLLPAPANSHLPSRDVVSAPGR